MEKLFAIPLIFVSVQVWADHPAVAFGNEGAGPINTISATTMPQGNWSAGIRTEIIENDAFSHQKLERFAEQGLEGVHSIDRIRNTSFSAAYGVTDDLTLSVRLPYIERDNIRESEIEDGEAEAHEHGDSSGWGDVLLFGQYRLIGQTSQDAALLFGIKTPTGETHEKDANGQRFETEFQPGSGSWDYLLGAAYSYNHDKFGYHANVLINKTSAGSQSTEIGDSLTYNLAVTYRLNGHKHHSHEGKPHTDINWDAVLEVNGETRRKNQIGSHSDDNSGGTTLLLAPGLRVSAGDFSGFVSVGLPFIENMNGKQTDIDMRILAGVAIAL